MTSQYEQESINQFNNQTTLEIISRDERQVISTVPAGTTASYQRVKIPGILNLSQLSWSSIITPGVGESVALRLFRVRPLSNPAGFGFIQLNNTFTVNIATFTDPGGVIDISSSIIPGLCVLPGEMVACSWVHSGPQTMEPFNMNWNFIPVSIAPPEPVATTIVYSDVFGP